MLDKHRPCICTRQINIKILERAVAGNEVAVAVRRTEHLPCGFYILIVTPLLRLIITASLYRHARLETQIASHGELALEGSAEHLCARAVISFSDAAHTLIRRLARLSERIGVLQQGKEALRHKIQLHASETVVPVARKTERMRPLLLQVVR